MAGDVVVCWKENFEELLNPNDNPSVWEGSGNPEYISIPSFGHSLLDLEIFPVLHLEGRPNALISALSSEEGSLGSHERGYMRPCFAEGIQLNPMTFTYTPVLSLSEADVA